MSRALTLTLLVAALTATPSMEAAGARSPDGVWTSIGQPELESGASRGLTPWIRPLGFWGARLDTFALDRVLDGAPLELRSEDDGIAATLILPTPNGGFERFAVVESPVMAPELQQWMADQGYPMRTYRGTSLDHPATNVRLDWGGPSGFHASVLSPGRSYYVDPYWQGDSELYASYFRHDFAATRPAFECFVDGDSEPSTERVGTTTNGNLRTYRLAVAATGEYTAFHGGTAVLGQAAIVTTVNRVNQVYENDLSIRMTLVGNNQSLVYTNSGTDPYSNGDGIAMLGQNQANVDSVIGSANYDIGHVVSTGGGGVASLGVPCQAWGKARGVTGSSQPQGDPFDIDFVAHEIGHQWDGRHTFNSETGSCGGGNRSGGTAYEPGSGATIQAYAGICGSDNLQPNSDPYFHGISLDEMLSYSGGTGATCATNIAGVNPNAPTVNAGAAYTIPANTPFELTVASSNDNDGDDLTFTWEEFDLGPATTLASGDNGSSPILRSWPPTSSTTQSFPNNGHTPALGEVLPTTSRTMSFRLTARDNRSGGGRVGEDGTTVTSTTSAGPFQVTAPNGGESWAGSQTITWNVASTSGGSVNAANVDILLSTDGGSTWPTTLVSSTPNDGSHQMTLPTVTSSSARIKVKGSGNIFFDTSDGNFIIGAAAQCSSPALTIPESGTVQDELVVASGDSIADLDVSIDTSHTFIGDLTFTLTHVGTGTAVVIIDRPGFAGTGFGCSGDNIVATLDDEAASSVEDQCTGNPAISGTFSPNNPLSGFDGESLVGTWRLSITDSASPDGGTLNQWCLIAGSVAPETPIFADGFETGNVSSWSSSIP